MRTSQLQAAGAAITYARCEQKVEHGKHWTLARYELPIIEQPGRAPIAEDYEKLAYTHNFTGKRVEFERPRYYSVVSAAELDRIRADWDAYVASRPAPKKHESIIGHIVLPRTTADIIDEWKRLAKDPAAVAWPGRAEYEYALRAA